MFKALLALVLALVGGSAFAATCGVAEAPYYSQKPAAPVMSAGGLTQLEACQRGCAAVTASLSPPRNGVCTLTGPVQDECKAYNVPSGTLFATYYLLRSTLPPCTYVPPAPIIETVTVPEAVMSCTGECTATFTVASSTVTHVIDWVAPPLNLTLEEGGQIAIAIVAVWVVGWAFRAFRKTLNTDGNSTSTESET